MTRHGGTRDWSSGWRWLLVCGFNAVPSWAIATALGDDSPAAMAAGVVAWGVVGFEVCARRQRLGRQLWYGGWYLGLGQLLLIPQLIAGAVAVGCTSWLRADLSVGRLVIPTFLATIITGAILISFAYLAGSFAILAGRPDKKDITSIRTDVDRLRATLGVWTGETLFD